MFAPFLLLTLLATPALSGSVSVDPVRWAELQPALPVPPVSPPSEVIARILRITRAGDGVDIDATWVVRGGPSESVAALLCDGSVEIQEATWNGRALDLRGDEQGRWFTATADGDASLRLRGHLTLVDGTADLRLLDAPRGTVEGPADLDVLPQEGETLLPHGVGRWVGGAASLRLAPRAAPADLPPWLEADVVTGVEVDDGSAQIRSSLAVRALRGSFDRLDVELPEGADVDPPEGARVEGEGRSRVLVFASPRSEATVVVRQILAVPEGDEAAIQIHPPTLPSVDRVRRYAVLGRASEVDVAIRDPDWRVVLAEELPEARSNVLGLRPVAWLRDDGVPDPLDLVVLRLRPLDRSEAVATSAELRAALTEEGAVLLRMRWDLQNERLPRLRVGLPAGARVAGVRVDERAVAVAVEGQDLLIPVPRSVQTVKGPLSFPVELTLLIAAPVLRPGERWELPVPVVSVPVAELRAWIHLPPGLWDGDGLRGAGRVTTFPGEAPDGPGKPQDAGVQLRRAAAKVALRGAVDAWKGNEFRKAKALIDDAKDLGEDSRDLDALSSNLAALGIGGEVRDDQDARNLKNEAQARAVVQEKEVAVLEEKAEQAAAAGDWAQAETLYSDAGGISEDLAAIAQVEDRSAARRRESLADKAQEARVRASRQGPARSWGSAVLLGAATPGELGFSGSGMGMGGGGSGIGYGRMTGKASAPVATAALIPIPRLGVETRHLRALLAPGESPRFTVRATRRPPLFRPRGVS